MKPIMFALAGVAAIAAEMRNPMPTTGVPKNSATIAPISASVEFSLSAVNTCGSAAGRRSRASVAP